MKFLLIRVFRTMILQPKISNELVSIKSGSLYEDIVSTFETHLWGDILDREKQWC